MKTQQTIDKKLDFSTDSKAKFTFWLSNIWQFLVDILFQDNELKVWEKKDKQGNIYWKIYHPATGNTVYLASEQEARIWIDRYVFTGRN
jgi:hypothetical protein